MFWERFPVQFILDANNNNAPCPRIYSVYERAPDLSLIPVSFISLVLSERSARQQSDAELQMYEAQ